MLEDSDTNTPTKENISDFGIETKSPLTRQKISPDRLGHTQHGLPKLSPINLKNSTKTKDFIRGRLMSGKRSSGPKLHNLAHLAKIEEANKSDE